MAERPLTNPRRQPPTKHAMRQYLDTSNSYQQHLCRLADDGLFYVVECTDESCEPGYEGFRTEREAVERAQSLETSTGYSHDVIKIQVDEDGDFWTDYKHR